jgi:hypothetical protein
MWIFDDWDDDPFHVSKGGISYTEAFLEYNDMTGSRTTWFGILPSNIIALAVYFHCAKDTGVAG